jgi:hypothetical protein
MQMAVSTSAKPARHAMTRLDWHARLALIVAVAMGYTVLFAAQVYSFTYLPGVLLALAFGYYRLYDPKSAIVPDFVWTGLTLLLVLGLMALSFAGRIFFLDALNWIFLLLPLIKLLTAKAERDYLQLYALAFGQILYGTIVNTDLSFGLVLAAYMAVAMWGLILLSFRVEATRRPQQGGLGAEIEKEVFSKRYLGVAAMLPIVALLMTFALFFIIPRPGSATLNFNFMIGKRQSGFSDTVNLGEMGEIKLNSAVAMRVEVGGRQPQMPIYWRGAVLDTFDGMTWTAKRFPPLPVFPIDHMQRLFSISGVADSRLTRQTVFLVDLDAKYIIHADFLHRVKVNSGQILLHGNGSVTLPPQFRYIESYTVWSHPQTAVNVDDEIMASFLQLPENIDPRILELTKRVTQDARSPLEAALAIQRFLKSDYSYSLKAGLTPASDPMAHFLFESKAGHCEYFASAMTLMLRQLGIHTRYVTGFQQGEYNPIEGYYIVRQSDAHTWPEAYIDGAWMSFEPTPSMGLSSYVFDFWSGMGQVIDAAAFRWQRYVVAYTVRDQIETLLKASNEVNMLKKGQASKWLKDIVGTMGYSIGGLIALLLVFRLWVLVSKRKQGDPRQILPYVVLTRRFMRLTRRLKKSGVPYSRDLTPAEWLDLCAQKLPESRPDLMSWLAFFHPLRYGLRPIGDDDLRRLDELEENILRHAQRK